KTAKLDEYKDGVEVSAYATNAMQWANAEGLITGKTSVTLVPKGSATRAEVATILMRFCENIVK
ncbi:MAG: S-layer homology domain-containing protein, partial [Agathobaculum sp.]